MAIYTDGKVHLMSPERQLIYISITAGILNLTALVGGIVWGMTAFMNLAIPALGSLAAVWLVRKGTQRQ
ncbi:hypothetical protein [Streptomyces mirabilis]|uniref:hypothetical protein n=1 Tax=Streptomyces mirabilis TaxID=68239 RepID=UPI0033240577